MQELKEVFRFEHGDYVFIGSVTSDSAKLFLEAQLIEASETEDEKKEDSAPFDLSVFITLISQHCDTSMLDQVVLKELLEKLLAEGSVSRRRIAKGIEPKPGTAGKLVFTVKRFQRPKAEVAPDQVDKRFMHLFDNIPAGTTVGRVYPPKGGTPGKDVFGKEIKPEAGAEASYKIDKTITLHSPQAEGEYSVLKAEQSGYLTQSSGTYTIKEELRIDSDIDYRVGNIDFIGKVIVVGDVHHGFHVHGLLGVEVRGNVYGASIHSNEGPILVKGGIFGFSANSQPSEKLLEEFEAEVETAPPPSKIRCSQDLRVRILHTVSVEVGGGAIVEKEIQRSVVRSYGALMASSAHVFGGRLYCVCGLEAGVLGAESEVATRITLCSDVESTFKYAGLIGKINQYRKAEEALKVYLGIYAEQPKRMQLLKGEHKLKMEDFFQKLKVVESVLQKLEVQKEKELKDAVYNSTQRVNFKKKLYPNVKVKFLEQEYISEGTTSGPKTLEYITDSEKFEMKNYTALSCDFESSAS